LANSIDFFLKKKHQKYTRHVRLYNFMQVTILPPKSLTINNASLIFIYLTKASLFTTRKSTQLTPKRSRTEVESRRGSGYYG